MSFEHSRDFRSSAQDSKRNKEHKEKWSRGSRPSVGVKLNYYEPDFLVGGSETQREKIRPERSHDVSRLPTPNIVKPRLSGHMRHDIHPSHSRAKVDALVELQDPSNISRSLHELMPSPHNRRKLNVSDNFLYSFDRTESPGKPLSLDIFVKTNPKETEKFIEKEYEILDVNGDALKGRKARQNLRRKNNMPMALEPEIIEDDGFELV
ncbi:Uu.00g047160.m01.CDS01 [Anthostomella pinea]|uniref:Uu.00g047160.m01.CDS01 n=1 Tax=Anthostomella pinea TaxID=933095 RepID=A0AAI8V6G0_9PEZI|nr:Uu.00g047160.m01.CDS01 [Anthostomella pinea]